MTAASTFSALVKLYRSSLPKLHNFEDGMYQGLQGSCYEAQGCGDKGLQYLVTF
ncbi:unnamed protein product [Rhodiola kirilowii]